MIRIDAPDILRMQADLKAFAHRAYPFATKATLNGAAFSARTTAQTTIRRDFVNRNRFSANSIRVEKVRGLNVSRQAATVGSVAAWMETQEFGGTKSKRGKRGVPIPTSYSAGQGQEKQPRTRLPRGINKLAAIQLLKNKRGGKSRKQRNLVAVKQAARTGHKVIYMDLGRRQGLFRVAGSKSKPRVRMLYDLSSPSVHIPRHPWLAPTVATTQLQIPSIYRKALIFQMNRNNLFSRKFGS